MSYDCIIIGAGPAGLMAGNFLKGVHALVLEGEENRLKNCFYLVGSVQLYP